MYTLNKENSLCIFFYLFTVINFQGSGNRFTIRNCWSPTCLGTRQCVQYPVCMGPESGLQEECWPRRGQGQSLWAGAGTSYHLLELVHLLLPLWHDCLELRLNWTKNVFWHFKGSIWLFLKPSAGYNWNYKKNEFNDPLAFLLLSLRPLLIQLLRLAFTAYY